MVKKSFTNAAAIEADNAKLVDGEVMTESKARLQKKFAKMEGPNSWLDITLGMTNKQKEAYELAQANKDSNAVQADVDPQSREAFNFDEELTVVRKKREDASQYTKNEAETLGDTAYDPPEESEGGQSSWESEESDIWDTGSAEQDEALGGRSSKEGAKGGGGMGFQIENMGDLPGMAAGAGATGDADEDYESERKKLEDNMNKATEDLETNMSGTSEFKEDMGNENNRQREEGAGEQLTLERVLEAKAGTSKEDQIRILQEALAKLSGNSEEAMPTEQSGSGPPDKGSLLRSQSQPDNPTRQTAEGAVPGADAVGYDKGAVGTAEAGRSPD